MKMLSNEDLEALELIELLKLDHRPDSASMKSSSLGKDAAEEIRSLRVSLRRMHSAAYHFAIHGYKKDCKYCQRHKLVMDWKEIKAKAS